MRWSRRDLGGGARSGAPRVTSGLGFAGSGLVMVGVPGGGDGVRRLLVAATTVVDGGGHDGEGYIGFFMYPLNLSSILHTLFDE
ncbi:hypothetical protein Drorol1_Dr00024997 [Drosera rotundifolia]